MNKEFGIKLIEKFNENKKGLWKEVKKERGVGGMNIRIKIGWSSCKC